MKVVRSSLQSVLESGLATNDGVCVRAWFDSLAEGFRSPPGCMTLIHVTDPSRHDAQPGLSGCLVMTSDRHDAKQAHTIGVLELRGGAARYPSPRLPCRDTGLVSTSCRGTRVCVCVYARACVCVRPRQYKLLMG